jgi:diguanylate cyclase (GGDEF)-like protein
MFLRSTPVPTRQRRPVPWRGLAPLLAGLLWSPLGHADERLDAARHLAAVDPQSGVAALATLRADALARSDAALRAQVDELECRLQADLDGRASLRVAREGLAALGEHPPTPLRPLWQRLRTCHAGALIQSGEVERGRALLHELVIETEPGSDPWAMARLERGVDRTRQGAYNDAQTDLLAACSVLEREGHWRDRDLCRNQLANHFRRLGDADEALRLSAPLREAARAAGEDYDASVYGYAVASALIRLGRWAEALTIASDCARFSERASDPLGQAYALGLVARAHRGLGQPAEALQAADQALALMDAEADEREHNFNRLQRAAALLALGRAPEALLVLDRVQASIDRRAEQEALTEHRALRAEALARLERWREAYDALHAAREADARLARQRVSEQSARLGMQFNRERDNGELATLRALHDQGQRLRQTQLLALGLALLLLAGVGAVVVHKVRQARQWRLLADTDELTGLPNRRALMALAAQADRTAAAAGAPLALLVVDIDHFKRVNDAHGHAAGDGVLRHVAQALSGALREGDRLGRLGGEEFVAVLPGAGLAEAIAVAERMRAAVAAAPAPVGPLTVVCTVSVGVACAPAGGGLEVLLGRADAALYQAKAEGRDRVEAAAQA